MARRLTVKDLLDQRGKHPFAVLRVETLAEAEAAQKTGAEGRRRTAIHPARDDP